MEPLSGGKAGGPRASWRSGWIVLVLVSLVGGCRTSSPNPFTEGGGTIRLVVINRSISSTRGTVFGGEQEYRLGLIVSQERRRFDIPWVGRSDLVVALARTRGGRPYRTFPLLVRPGDELVLTLENNLFLSQLRFGRPGR